MANPIPTNILDLVAAAVKTAWSPAKIVLGQPRLLNTSLPFASVDMISASLVTTRATTVRYGYQIAISGRFAFPATATDKIANEKIERANELHNAMITGSQFSGIGDIHRIEQFLFDESGEEGERVYEVGAVFYIEIDSARV